jgi:putative transcriptional regulator
MGANHAEAATHGLFISACGAADESRACRGKRAGEGVTLRKRLQWRKAICCQAGIREGEALMQSFKGYLLVSVPSLLDPNFLQSVTLLVEHNDEGALGLVLNRPTATTVGQIWEQLTESPCDLASLLYEGGPCQGLLSVLHTKRGLASEKVFSGVYFTQEPKKIDRLIEQQVQPARYFVGYAGWAPGQLENELEQGSWLTTPAQLDDVFGNEEELWERLRNRIAKTNILDALNIRHYPDDPSLN